MPKIRIARLPLEQAEEAAAKPVRDKGVRLWAGTRHNADRPREFLESLVSEHGAVWSFGQLERCPTTQKLHVQFAVQFKHQKALKAMKLIDPTAHWEPAKGNVNHQVAYCSKTDSKVEGPWEFGTRPAQGARNDLAAVADAVKSGATLAKIAGDHPVQFIKYYRGIAELQRYFTPERQWLTRCFYLCGKSGIGKSYGFHHLGLRRDDWFEPTLESISGSYNFNGYSGQPVIFIDEVMLSSIQRSMLLHMGNSYPYSIPIKGGQPVPFLARFVFMVANDPPSEKLLMDDAFCRRYDIMQANTRDAACEYWEARRADLRSGGVVLPATSEAEGLSGILPGVPISDPSEIVDVVGIGQSQDPPSESC